MSPAHLGRKRSPFPGTGGWAPLGPLAETAAKPQRTRCSGKKGRELHFPAAFCSAARLQARSAGTPAARGPPRGHGPASASWRCTGTQAQRARRPPPPQTAAGQTGCFHSRVFRGLGPSGFLPLATAECSGKENVHLHPKWLPHLKPSLSQGLPPEPGSQELWGRTGGSRSKPHPAGSVWGREPCPPGLPSQLLEDGGQRQVAQGQGRATEKGGGGPTGDALVSGPGRKPQDEPTEKWEREIESHRHHVPRCELK